MFNITMCSLFFSDKERRNEQKDIDTILRSSLFQTENSSANFDETRRPQHSRLIEENTVICFARAIYYGLTRKFGNDNLCESRPR